MTRAIVLLIATLAGCTERVQLGDDISELVSLSVTPGPHTLDVVGVSGPAITIDFTAIGEFSDGRTRDLSSLVEWQIDNPAPGDFLVGNHYRLSRRAAGDVTIRAVAGEIVATTQLRITITATLNDPAFPPPLGAEALFETATRLTDGLRAPRILYPSQETMFPQGLAQIVFQHQLGEDNDAIRLRFESEWLHLTVLTSADRWQPDRDLWYLISASNRGAQTAFTVEGASTRSPGMVYTSATETLRFAATGPGGVLSYRVVDRNSILRAKLDSTIATQLYPALADPSVVSTHTVSRDGAVMALGYGGDKLQTVKLSDLSVQVRSTANLPMGWATFSPDGKLLLVANQGQLVLRDASTGQPIGPDGGRINLPMKATHPDWSPDGTQVAIAMSNEITNTEIKNGSIAILPFKQGAFDAPEILVSGGAASNNYFPKWSPDGRSLAYVNAKAGPQGARTTELRILPAAGGPSVSLSMASRRTNGREDRPDLGNTMPWWIPANGSVSWIAFSSIRPYGVIQPNADRAQIWIAGVDLTRTNDPSFAAFWLPSQDMRTVNYNPVWAPAFDLE